MSIFGLFRYYLAAFLLEISILAFEISMNILPSPKYKDGLRHVVYKFRDEVISEVELL